MTGLIYASGWDGRVFPSWPVRPPAPCGICGQPGRPYLPGHRCDTHRLGTDTPPAAPSVPPPALPASALDHAHRRWPGARRCATTDDRQRPVCPYPLDPANGDHAMHGCCDPVTQPDLAAARHAEARRRSAPARAAVAAKGAAT